MENRLDADAVVVFRFLFYRLRRLMSCLLWKFGKNTVRGRLTSWGETALGAGALFRNVANLCKSARSSAESAKRLSSPIGARFETPPAARLARRLVFSWASAAHETPAAVRAPSATKECLFFLNYFKYRKHSILVSSNKSGRYHFFIIESDATCVCEWNVFFFFFFWYLSCFFFIFHIAPR